MQQEVINEAVQEWSELPVQNKLRRILSQFLTNVKVSPDYKHFEPSFMLKTRRIEYTLEFFRNVEKSKTRQDVADMQFINEMRFQMTRLVGVSYLIGINSAFASYLFAFHRLKWYVSLPATFTVYFLTRNLVMKHCVDKVYYPI